jgi:hypothetical protein
MTGDLRACARSLQFRHSLDQCGWRRESDCGKRDVDVDIHGVVGVAE